MSLPRTDQSSRTGTPGAPERESGPEPEFAAGGQARSGPTAPKPAEGPEPLFSVGPFRRPAQGRSPDVR